MAVQHVFTGEGAPGGGVEPTVGAHYIDTITSRHWVGVSDDVGVFWRETFLLREANAAPTFTPTGPEVTLVEGAVPEVHMAISDGEGGYAWHRLALYADIGGGA